MHHRYRTLKLLLCTAIGLLLCGASVGWAQPTAFTYQGKLTDAGNPANGNYDLQYQLFDTPTVGTGAQQGASLVRTPVAASAGVFTVTLDFGANVFNGAARYLEIAVRPAGSPDPYTTLAPRQPITSAPYAIRSLVSTAADGLSVACVNCVTSSQIQAVQGAQVSGAIPVASIPAGSNNYIQNAAALQPGANFNIAGDGTAGGTLSGNVVNAATQYNIGGVRVLSSAGTRNTFTGVSAGQANASGLDNAFFGFNAGLSNSTGARNTYAGVGAGQANVNGHDSTFFGFNAGLNNTGTGGANAVANFNSFFGANAGRSVTFGGFNSFFGGSAGSNSTGNTNSFFGFGAGSSNAGDDNAIFGVSAGQINKGNRNSIFGVSAGRQSFFGVPDPANTGDDNSFFGNGAGAHNTASGNAFFGSGAGSANTTSARNAFFGASAGINTDGGSNSFDLLGADNSFFGYQAGKGNVGGRTNAYFGSNAGLVADGAQNSFFGANAGKSNGFTVNNTFIGYNTGSSNISGGTITLIGANANVAFDGLGNATAIGANALVTRSNSIVLGGSSSVTAIVPGSIEIGGTIMLGSVGPGAGGFALCRNSGNSPGLITFCSSSLRYKTDVQPFSAGLALVRRLHPISFTWKSDHTRDLGLGAEDVAAVEPLLTFRNDKSEIEGVKYDRLSAVLVNAVQEQQTRIERQQRKLEQTQLTNRRQQQQLETQQTQIGSLKRLVCLSHPLANICK